VSEPIKCGDLVAVIRPTECCNGPGSIGLVGTVTNMVEHGVFRCNVTGWRHVTACVQIDGDAWIERSRVKKLDAPLNDETVDETKEITA